MAAADRSKVVLRIYGESASTGYGFEVFAAEVKLHDSKNVKIYKSSNGALYGVSSTSMSWKRWCSNDAR